MKRLRKGMLCLFCGGIFLCGLGMGVAFGEYSGFQYGGEVVLAGKDSETEWVTAPVFEESEKIYLPEEMKDLEDIVYSDEVPEDEVWFQVTYNGAVSQISVSTWLKGDSNNKKKKEYISLSPESGDLKSFMQIKDAVLADLKNSRISSYQIQGIEKIRAKANPVLKGKLYPR